MRCRGTAGERTTFTVRADTVLWFEQTLPTPVTFVFVGPLAVEPFAHPTAALGISLHESATGIFITAVYGSQRVSQAVVFDRWEQLHLPPHTSFWVQVTPGV